MAQTIYDIVKAHGGELKVETLSVPERAGLSAEAAAQAGKVGEGLPADEAGTTFIIRLPK
jgi:signal transduction histidine kinase